jgi:Protein of unknown function DUF262/Restriction Enzyme Adenine Methylase Associated/Protein of unknown function (DUF1524)
MADAPIGGRAYTVEQLFSEHRFGLDYYQREYTWSREDVKSLLDDLVRRFHASWKPTDGRAATTQYGPYFLGPIVYFEDESVTYLVDGQQRVTTLHLLLIYLRGLLRDQEADDDVSELEKLISKVKHGRRTFSVDIPERSALLTSLFRGKPYVLPPNPTPSVRNLYERVLDLDEDFPVELRDDALLHFLDWLLGRVCLVGIRALSRDHGWEIFETMNDRGARLSPVDLLKSFLLSRSEHGQPALNKKWRAMLTHLSAHQSRTPSDFIKTFLVAKYSDPGDDSDRLAIETAAHEWVRQHALDMGLATADDFHAFVDENICGLAESYGTLVAAGQTRDNTLEHVYYNAANGLSVQLVLILAAVAPDDDRLAVKDKAKLIASFLDLVYVRKLVNGNATQANELADDIYALVPKVRVCSSLADLTTLLSAEIANLDDDFSGIATFGLRPDNKPQVRYLLSRITAFLEVECGRPNRIHDYLDKQRPHEIEHIWANKFERYQHEVKTQAKFHSTRNRLGALLLLPKSDNASYQADAYADKVNYYYKQNLLAASLNEISYRKNPEFSKFRKRTPLVGRLFHPYVGDFSAKAVDERQKLYQVLCETVWDPARLGFDVPKIHRPEHRVARRTRARYDVKVGDLVATGTIKPNEQLQGEYKGQRYSAVVQSDGRIRVESGELFNAPSPAAMFLIDRQACNGWDFWKVRRGSRKVTLKSIRDEALRAGLLEQEGLRLI